MKTRVLKEQSQYDTKYYPQVQKKFLFWRYWSFVSSDGGLDNIMQYAMLRQDIENTQRTTPNIFVSIYKTIQRIQKRRKKKSVYIRKLKFITHTNILKTKENKQ